LNNLRKADRIYPVSQTNAEFLQEEGFDMSKIKVIPDAVRGPPPSRLLHKRRGPIQVAFLGRIVAAKGVLDLIKALARIVDADLPPFRLKIAGNLEQSNSKYCDEVREALVDTGLEAITEFMGTIDERAKEALLHDSHILAIPSYHEGFCKPVIEALMSGCVPVGYAAYNLRYIGGGFGRMVPVGDIDALGTALAECIKDIASVLKTPSYRFRTDGGFLTEAEFFKASSAYTQQFRPERISKLVRDEVAFLLEASVNQRGIVH
jgi:glycosyltransferase involved in cell wall biosynthesis